MSRLTRRLLREGVENGFERVGWDTLRLVAFSFYADAASRLRAVDAAALIHEQMAQWQDHFTASLRDSREARIRKV